MTQSPTHPEKILVVDDEALIRYDLVDLLEERGFAPLEASDADAAILILEADTGIRAVLTDVNMPGSMDGIKLAHYIRGRWPPVALFIISAQNLNASTKLPEMTRFYSKPFDADRLVKDLRAALAG